MCWSTSSIASLLSSTLPSTLRSASRSCGGSLPVTSLVAFAMRGPPDWPLRQCERTGCRNPAARGSRVLSTGCGGRDGPSGGRGGGHHPDLDVGIDLGMQLDLDRVHAEFLERSFKEDVFGFDRIAGRL